MDDEERRYYMYRIDHLTRTLQVLELQVAQFGIYTSANIQVEIEDIKRDIRAYEGFLGAASAPQTSYPNPSVLRRDTRHPWESNEQSPSILRQTHRSFRDPRLRQGSSERKRNPSRRKQHS